MESTLFEPSYHKGRASPLDLFSILSPRLQLRSVSHRLALKPTELLQEQRSKRIF